MGELYERLGYAGWFRPGAERALMAAMRARMGAARGFSAVMASALFKLDKMRLFQQWLPVLSRLADS